MALSGINGQDRVFMDFTQNVTKSEIVLFWVPKRCQKWTFLVKTGTRPGQNTGISDHFTNGKWTFLVPCIYGDLTGTEKVTPIPYTLAKTVRNPDPGHQFLTFPCMGWIRRWHISGHPCISKQNARFENQTPKACISSLLKEVKITPE